LLTLNPVKLVEYTQTDSNTILIKKTSLNKLHGIAFHLNYGWIKKLKNELDQENQKKKITKKTEIL
jgi:hypothetical protein